MVDLVLSKTKLNDPSKEWALLIRDFSSGVEVDWTTICYMDSYTARQLNNERVYFRDGDPEEKPLIKALRLEHPSLREAWENYQTLKALFMKNK